MQAKWHDTVIAQSTETVLVDMQLNEDAAWYDPDPEAAAIETAGRFASWKGVAVTAP